MYQYYGVFVRWIKINCTVSHAEYKSESRFTNKQSISDLSSFENRFFGSLDTCVLVQRILKKFKQTVIR